MQTVKTITRKYVKEYQNNKLHTMSKQEFIDKWKIDKTSVYYYVKRFPEIKKGTIINYSKLDKIIEHRATIKKQVSDLMILKKPKEIEWLFKSKNAKTISHIFCYQLHSTTDQILVRDSNYKKYLQILEYFGVQYDGKN